ncbi:related to CBP3 - mitochondrial protein required for assembly of cytochrome bc1 complex [Ustilago trichophora]|uniref:Related to CBP3 - mitochondrial protein required for assembly of cytochrome bc1 complex n=1 Tax=Ustilago trichophora TaxID=86804 RepID=A0A5C3EI44_9BASI|nr:related to CBP3 - mitochondrial protein required for assembly of cytochrome bc1 complex [Ustilago trichophora]
MLVQASTFSWAAVTRNGVLLPGSSSAAVAATRTYTSTRTTSAPASSSAVRKASPSSKPAPLLHTSQLSPSAPAPSKEPYSPVTVAIVKGLAKLMGYNSLTSTSIRVTSDLYDRCAERAHVERNFWYGDCALPETYQSWFQITNLHVYLLLARFRAFDKAANKTYSQEIINHFFIDAESRMRDRFGVQTSRLVKGYMKDMHMQHRGSVLGYDEGLAGGDARLAQAVWRNIWGAGWGTVAGVKRKLAGVDKLAEGEKDDPEGQPELARDAMSLDPRIASRPNASPYARAASASLAADRANAQASTLPPQANNPATMPAQTNILPAIDPLAAAHPELAFPHHLHRIVTFIRAESHRLANLSDREIMLGRVEPKSPAAGSRSEEAAKATASIASFRRI